MTIPESIWATMLDIFATEHANVERVAYLDGVGVAGEGIVTTLVVPDAELHPSWYDVSPDAMSDASHAMREHGLVRLAQVHTHGGRGCEHSGRDDEKAYSQRPGSLSIVLPFHASQRPSLTDAVVHLRTDEGWNPLTPTMALTRVRVVPSVVDLRRRRWNASQIGTPVMPAGFWHRLMRRVRSRSRLK